MNFDKLARKSKRFFSLFTYMIFTALDGSITLTVIGCHWRIYSCTNISVMEALLKTNERLGNLIKYRRRPMLCM